MKKPVTDRGVIQLALTGALLGLAACASSGSTAPPSAFAATTTTSGARAEETSQASPHAALAVAVRARSDGAGDDPRGILVLHEDVMAHCSSLQSGAASDSAVGKTAWLGVMRAVATCMKDGSLKDRDLVLHGPSRPQVVVKYIFAKLGVPEARVQMSAPDSASCASDDDCTAAERRVEIGLTGTMAGAVGAL
jgi:hypothetical protein